MQGSARARDIARLTVQLTVCFALVKSTSPVFAHGAERGLVMLLPGELYIAGSALAVFATFFLLSVIPPAWVERAMSASTRLFPATCPSPVISSLLSFTVLSVLVISGFTGTRDPLLNPLPVFIWTLWWVVFTSIQCITGNLWNYLNPWSGPVRLIRKVSGFDAAPISLPVRFGYLPAILLFSGFAWFELVSLSPEDPQILASVVSVYWLVNMAAILLFGERTWFERGEPFAIFYRLIGSMAPVQVTGNRDSSCNVNLVCPGAGLTRLPAVPFSGILFVLLTLSSVSFDGISRTFLWLGFIDVNPLEFPGRSAVVTSNSIGMLATFIALAGIFFICVYAGCVLADQRHKYLQACGRLVYSIIPISLVFHAAHYLTQVLVNIQYTVPSLKDPFALGWNSTGADEFHVTTSFLNHIGGVEAIWIVQTILIVLGHIIGIWVAHTIAIQIFEEKKKTVKSQLFLAGLMVSYTIFGLWLLSTASI